jgi:hypothetical protein
MKSDQAVPEIYCDLNAGMTENGYSLERRGSIEDLAKLGLTLEQAVGMKFIFNGGEDSDENGNPADIMFNGFVVKDSRWGYLAVSDEDGVYWRVRK